MRPARTLGDRVTKSRIPVNGSIRPSENPPVWLGGIGGTAFGLVTAAIAGGLTGWQVVVFALGGLVVGTAAGIYTQRSTIPALEAADHDGLARRIPLDT